MTKDHVVPDREGSSPFFRIAYEDPRILEIRFSGLLRCAQRRTFPTGVSPESAR